MSKLFKALSYGRIYVDELRLNDGIYETLIPTLHSEDETISTMIDRADNVAKYLYSNYDVEEYKKNLKNCTLVIVSLDCIF